MDSLGSSNPIVEAFVVQDSKSNDDIENQNQGGQKEERISTVDLYQKHVLKTNHPNQHDKQPLSVLKYSHKSL